MSGQTLLATAALLTGPLAHASSNDIGFDPAQARLYCDGLADSYQVARRVSHDLSFPLHRGLPRRASRRRGQRYFAARGRLLTPRPPLSANPRKQKNRAPLGARSISHQTVKQ